MDQQVNSTPSRALILLVCLAPAAWLLWSARDLPHLGQMHDDAIYLVTAKSLAETGEYRLSSLPGAPHQSKYPPLYPWLLSFVWKAHTGFPENLPTLALWNWSAVPGLAFLTWMLFARPGFDRNHSWLLAVAVALTPFVALMGTYLLSDLLFVCLLFATLIAVERVSSVRGAVLAGLIAGLAHLTRTAAIPLLATVPLGFILQRRYKLAAAFFAAMLPAVLLWGRWSAARIPEGTDVVSLYYLNYTGFYFYDLRWKDLPLFVWKNLDALALSFKDLLMFDIGEDFWIAQLARLLTIGAVAGIIRSVRRSGVTHYHLYAAAFTAMMLVWHYSPTGRLILPIYPLLLAGLSVEIVHLAIMLKRAFQEKPAGERVIAAGLLAGLAMLGGFVIWRGYGNFTDLFPRAIAAERAQLTAARDAYAWIATNVRDGLVFSYRDPVIYLYSGAQGVSQPKVTKPYYREDRVGVLRPFQEWPSFAREQKLTYFLLTANDLIGALPPAEAERIRKTVLEGPAFEKAYSSPGVTIYRVRNQPLNASL